MWCIKGKGDPVDNKPGRDLGDEDDPVKCCSSLPSPPSLLGRSAVMDERGEVLCDRTESAPMGRGRSGMKVDAMEGNPLPIWIPEVADPSWFCNELEEDRI